MKSHPANISEQNRLMSIDLFRGVVMLLLIGESTGLYDLLVLPRFSGSIIPAIGLQFHHHPWHGLRLWDLGQPFFMFISGVAMVFSYERRWARGESWISTASHALRRAFLLVVFGWGLSVIKPMEREGKGEFLLDVLPQLAFASLLAFLLLRKPLRLQLGFALGLIALTELLFRLWPLSGTADAFLPGRNFGTRIDLALFGGPLEGDWVAFNIVPAATHTLIGAVVGRLIKNNGWQPRKIMRLLIGAGLGVGVLGLALDPLTPIVRRISTSSFTFISCGGALLALGLAFWLVNIGWIQRRTVFFTCVGMNSIFVYLFAVSGGGEWLRQIVEPFSMGFSGWIGEWPAQFLTSLACWGMMWGLCWWLSRRKIFIKI